jgi:hypothetical protein
MVLELDEGEEEKSRQDRVRSEAASPAAAGR